jgi:YVTN family beta-propeller protein
VGKMTGIVKPIHFSIYGNEPIWVPSFTNIRRIIIIIMMSIFFVSISGLSEAGSPMIYCFWPGDTSPSNYQPDWNGLTHVAYFCWGVNSDGSLIEPSTINEYYIVRDIAHQQDKKVIISILTTNRTIQDNVLAYHSNDFANNVLNALKKYQADGVNIDFEASPDLDNSIIHTSNKPIFENFMKILYITLKTSNPNYHVSFCSGFSMSVLGNSNLSKYTDAVFIMGYDYTHWQGITGPNSPFNDPTRKGVNTDVDNFLNYYPAQKIILGVPFYGYSYTASSGQAGAKIATQHSIPMSTAISEAATHGRLWDSKSHTPWYRYQIDNVWHQVWYDDSESIGLKYNYTKSMNLGGLGIFCLGREGNDAAVWGLFNTSAVGSPIAAFSATPGTGNTPLKVTFNDRSIGSPTSWKWDFGDGTNSTEQNPMHIYYKVGTYTISLKASNENGTSSKLATINVLMASGQYAYITNYGNSTVSVIDTATNTITTTVKVGDRPFGVAVNPAGTKLYVTNPYGSNIVSVIDVAKSAVIARVPVGGNSPHGVAVTPDGKKVYVANCESNNVSVIDTTTNTVTTTVNVGSYPIGVTVTPDGTKIYVTNYNNNSVSLIDTTSNKVTATIPVGNNPYGIATNQQGTKVYVTNYNSSSVSVIDTSINKVIATVKTEKNPYEVTVNPQGTKAYATNYRSNSVSVIDTSTNAVIATVPVGRGPHGVTITPDGKKVYVTNWDDSSISVINTATNTGTTTVKVGSLPSSFGNFIVSLPYP